MPKILIGEDEPEVRAFLRETLESAGHEVVEEVDGIGVLDSVLASKPDLILLDWMIPAVTGGEVLQRLRNDEAYESVKDTPVIVVSDFDDEESKITFLHSGANDFVPKSDVPKKMKEHLLQSIRQALGG